MVHSDLNVLLNEGIRVAVELLEKNGEFLPFGITVSTDGEMVHVAGWTGDESPPSQELINLLLDGFAAGAERAEHRATALVCDVRISLDGTSKTDAISLTMEHVNDDPVTCYLPYATNGDALEFGTLVAERAERRVFKA